jgi:hypothetical protein
MLLPFSLCHPKIELDVNPQPRANSGTRPHVFPQHQPDRPSYSNFSLQRNQGDEADLR